MNLILLPAQVKGYSTASLSQLKQHIALSKHADVGFQISLACILLNQGSTLFDLIDFRRHEARPLPKRLF